MQSRNPVLSRNKAFARGGYATFGSSQAPRGAANPSPSLEDLYSSPSATAGQTGRMTYDDVVVRTGGMLATVVAAAAISWVLLPPGLWILAALVGFGLGLVNAFKREPSPALMLAYAAVQGVFLGGISKMFEGLYDGVVVQAVLATMTTFAVMLVLYRTRVIRVTKRFTKILLVAGIGYAVFSLINFALAITGVGNLRVGAFGLLIGAVGAVLAALFLTLDFDFVERGVENGIPARYAWTAAFGLTVTLIWLYIEFLRILSILRGN